MAFFVDTNMIGNALAYLYEDQYAYSEQAFLLGVIVGLKHGLKESGMSEQTATHTLLSHDSYSLHPDAPELIYRTVDVNLVGNLKAQQYPYVKGEGALIGWLTARMALGPREFEKARQHIVDIIGVEVWNKYAPSIWAIGGN